MPFISEAASAIKSRFGFQDQSSESMPSVRSSPDLLKSASHDNLFQSSAVRVFGERDDLGAGPVNQSFDLSEDPSFWKDHNVQVIIRVRPLSSSEISLQGYSRCVRQDSCQSITWTGHPESRFTFDVVADENVSQEKLFKVAGVPMVENCVGGYNSCMFAYGQTGSGKTHTMLGDIEGGTRRHSVNCGMTPRVFEYLFSRIQKIREDTKKGVYVDNLTEAEVTCARDVIQQLVQGAANRKVAATNMNHASSRSHSVFTCIIESKWESQGVTHHRFARLNLVDLAGSERQKSSGAEGERLKEATNINKSLSTLGLVIMNLVNISNGKSLHVPYRDSKLTFLLQDSLGGNSKTIIIANISPACCCSLETLSTLKFAQRAKFIKNHEFAYVSSFSAFSALAIVNEDASGDIIAMRVQIQQLKKEVSRLRGVVNGGENHESDAWTVSFPGSPGSFKWEGLHGSLSPLVSDKRVSHKKEYEVALVGAFRREKDKDIALQTLAAENKAALQLAKQREDEIQGLKMRLRFREAGIKRLEAVASGKMSAETHLLKEKEEHLKEIEVLRAQVDRNQEVTRFAMENLRLKEEIRRHVTLLEALDWKLMHESDPSIVQKGNSDLATDMHSDGNLLVSSQEPGSPWRTSINEENEFLRMQAIQNQSEMDALHKKLNFCFEERDKLERHVSDLVTELEAERSSKAQKEEAHKLQIELRSPTTDQMVNTLNDQLELKAMVDAIAAASQREAEAHETAIILSKENDELRIKLKVLIEDNNKLIEMYEGAVSENTDKSGDKVQNCQEYNTDDHINNFDRFAEKKLGVKMEGENLEHQLTEMHEENEKLMVLYEKAMQERDEFKRMFSSEGDIVQTKGELHCSEKLVEVDEVKCHKANEYLVSREAKPLREETRLFGSYVQDGGESLELERTAGSVEEEALLEGVNSSKLNIQDNSCHCSGNSQENNFLELDEPPSRDGGLTKEIGFLSLDTQDGSIPDTENQIDTENDSIMENNSLNLTMVKVSEDLDLVRMKLHRAQEKLLNSVETVSLFGSLEKAITEVDTLERKIQAVEVAIQMKQQEYACLKLLSCEIDERRALIDRKLMALKYSLSNFSSSVGYFEQREVQARVRFNASLSYVDRKKEELACLEACKNEIEGGQRKFQRLEVEITNNIAQLISKMEEENQRLENEKVLFAIDNLEKKDIHPSQRIWHLSGKATELLKSEEEKTKTQTEIKQAREKLVILRKESEDLKKKILKVENEMQIVQTEIQKGLKSVEEMEHKIQSVVQDKETILEMKENGSIEVENMILEYHQHTFEAELKEEEMKILDEELHIEFDRVRELQKAKVAAIEKKSQLLGVIRCDSCLEEIQDIRLSVMELLESLF
ncbi:hypothetical protein TEA_010978 [Camellia sinensis var. sinensis]|uniref:Kinesin motor domain-containing protein n=1 Tax=Camellia sinensis var. sinensis TaxID=542762 RepID=A0A4S4ES56_CAMSN|nr:hypothetical protein TEA_010978 [Camellia sinensis var. sinensis]